MDERPWKKESEVMIKLLEKNVGSV